MVTGVSATPCSAQFRNNMGAAMRNVQNAQKSLQAAQKELGTALAAEQKASAEKNKVRHEHESTKERLTEKHSVSSGLTEARRLGVEAKAAYDKAVEPVLKDPEGIYK